MNENLDQLQEEINNKNAVEERFINLNKGKKEAELKAETLAKEKGEIEAKMALMEKETAFLNSFSDVSTKFPTASEFKEKIKEKVMTSGYSVDDATVAVLHAEGRLSSSPTQQANVAGGSAPIQITNQANKPVNEMTQTEKWSALKQAEKEGLIGLQN